MKILNRLILFLLLYSIKFSTASACSAFSLSYPGETIMGKNYDHYFGEGLLIVNKRNIKKRAASVAPKDLPAQWTSKYGSLTFNQCGREFPAGGLNEAGLAVEVLWLENSKYPPLENNGIPRIDEAQWIQYMLDNFSSVEEVVKHAKDLQIFTRKLVKLHYYICDKKGEACIIAFLDGKINITYSRYQPVYALTNSSYKESIHFVKRQESMIFDPMPPDMPVHNPFQYNSLKRFFYLTKLIDAHKRIYKKCSIDQALNMLNKVFQSRFTQWNLIYECSKRRIYYRHRRCSDTRLRKVDFKNLDFSQKTPVMIADMTGNITKKEPGKFFPYNLKDNRRLLDLFNDNLSRWLGKRIPEKEIDYLSRYPEESP